MSVAYVKEVSVYTSQNPAATSIVVPVNANTASGNTLILVIAGRGDTVNVTGLTDSRGNTWFADSVSQETTSNSFVTINHGYMASPLQTGDSVFVTFDDPAGPALLVWLEEYSGLLTAGAVIDQTGNMTDTGSDSTPTVTTGAATAQAVELVVAAWVHGDTAGPNTMTPDAGFSSPATPAQITSGATPGDRYGLVSYAFTTSAGSQSNTPTLTGGATNIAGTIATFKAAPDTPDSPVASYFGNPISADSLANLEVGKYAGRKLSIRWRATHGGTISSITCYIKGATGYGAGTGGSVRCDVCTDDGTTNHYPTTTVLATRTITTPAVDDALTWTFTSPPTFVQGTIYHFVFTNTDAVPTANYISLDDLNEGKSSSPILPTQPDTDLAMLWQVTGPPWVVNLGHLPIFRVLYGDGTKKGQSYIDAIFSSGERNIGGSNNAVRMTFTPTQTISFSKVWFRFFKISGETANVSYILKSSGGSTIATATVAAASVPNGTTGSFTANWVAGTFSSQQTCNAGTTYRLEIWSTSAGATNYRAFPIQAGPGSGNFGAFDSDDLFTQGYWEYTTNAGTNWSTHLSSQQFKPQMYFETAQATPPSTPAPLGRTLRGVGA